MLKDRLNDIVRGYTVHESAGKEIARIHQNFLENLVRETINIAQRNDTKDIIDAYVQEAHKNIKRSYYPHTGQVALALSTLLLGIVLPPLVSAVTEGQTEKTFIFGIITVVCIIIFVWNIKQ